MAAPPLPAEIEQIRRDLIVDQAPSSRARTEIFRPGRFVQRYGRPYSSRRLPISTLEEMRTDALLRFAQMISLVPIFTGKWHIQCSNPRKAQFIDHALRQVIGRLILQFFESWNFGFQALVKEFGLTSPDWQFLDKEAEGGAKVVPVWDGGPEVPALVWQPFVPLSPRAVAPVWTPSGDFNGIALAQNGVGFGLPTVPFAQDDFVDILPELMASFINQDQQQRNKIDVDHALWVVNERDAQWGSIWGRPRLAYAFKYWWSYEMTLGILNRSVERKGDPTIVVSYPQGKSTVNGQEVDNQAIAMQIGESARSGAVLAVPSEVWGEDMATANQASKWKIDYLKAEERFDELRAVLDYLDTMKIRSMMVAELSFAEGSGGCLDGDTPILCPRDHGVYPDGVPLEDIEPGRLVWAFNQESMRFELWPVKGVWCTMDDADLYKLTLDDGQEIVGTPDHPFMSRDGVWRRMDELKPGDRLMPFYESGREISYSGAKLPEGDYEPMVLLDPDHGSFEIEYRVIGEHLGWTGQGARVNIHHDDGRHANTELGNLHCLTPGQHAEKHFRDPVHRQKHSDAVRAAMAALTPEKRAKLGKEHWDEARWKAFSERQAIVGLEAITKFRDSLTPEEYKAWCTSRAKATQDARRRNGTVSVPPRDKRACRGCSKEFQPRSSNSWYCQTCNETRNVRTTARVVDYEPGATNHRVVSVECLGEIGPVWDLEIDGPSHVRNFVAGGVVVHNTSSRNVAAVVGERTSEAQILTQAEWDAIINDYMIPQLANANFPELSDVPARKVTQSFGEGESALAADILRSLANSNAGELPLDVPALLERFQIDGLTGTDLEKWAARMANQAETSTKPPKIPATPDTAGTTDTGFYYAAPDQIVLEDDVLLASLPKSKHYSDSAVLAQTRLVRRLYKALLAAQYEDFAVHVARADLSLAEDDKAESAAARVVAAWRYTGELLGKTVKAVALALSRVLARAGSLELSASRIKTDVWKPDDSDLQQWARDRAGALVRGVDATTRGQLQTFLASELRAGRDASEIAANLRSHFAEFPNWRADLIAREETKRYYNAGTLFAAQAAGSDQVQALDAQDGPTDEECVVSGTLVHVIDASRSHARYYEGDAISLATADGEKLTVTPNHPVLTPDGWVAAGLLKQGDYVIRCPRPDLALRVAAPGCPDDHYEPLIVEQAAELPHVPLPHVAVGKATRGADFHGDGADSEVHVERTNRSLWERMQVAGGEQGCKPLFVRTIERSDGLLRERLSLEFPLGLDATARRGVGGGHTTTTLLGGHTRVFGAASSAGVAQGDASVGEELLDRERGTAIATPDAGRRYTAGVVIDDLVDGEVTSSDTYWQAFVDQQLPDPGLRGVEMSGDLLDALAGEAEPTQLVEIDRVWWQGHVYNFATSLGWYIAGGIITHNCERRNGRVFSVSDAWSESAREHVRGTLGWRIIPTGVQLSFTRRSREEMGEVAARIDQQERVVYLVEGMDSATEGRFLERAVDWLVRSA